MSTPASSTEAFVHIDRVGVTFQHEGQAIPAVDGVSLTVYPGEFAVVTGPSGCGKTTILKLLAGLLIPTQGTVHVGGRPVRGPLKNIGMAFQNPILLPWRRTLDNVLLPLEIVAPHKHQFRRNRAAHVAQASDLLTSVGLEGFGNRFPWQISGGQQQRASLCRALIHGPELLLLDEPFGALDAFTREELWQVLQRLWLQRRFTVVLVTHDLREAIFLADTVYVMSPRPGRLIYQISVNLPRPRSLEATFTAGFAKTYQEIRGHIGEGVG